MSQINRPPRGLQDLLGSLNFGKNPANLDQNVWPGIDMLAFWALDAQFVRRDTGGDLTTPAAVVNSYDVPFGEVWVPITFSCKCAYTNVGDQGGFTLELDRHGPVSGSLPAVGQVLAQADGPPALVIGHVFSASFTWDRPILYPSGTRFRVLTAYNIVAVGPTSATTTLHYLKLVA